MTEFGLILFLNSVSHGFELKNYKTMKDKFREIRLSKANKVKLDLINSIIQEYAVEKYTMTLRQLYYQLVSRDVIPNKQNEYAKISKLLKEGRMAGVVDWDAIEDRLRTPYRPYWVQDIKHAIDDTVWQYRLDRQKEQDVYIEVWVEKDALSNVLKRVTEEYHVYLMVNRGYGSITAIHDAFIRFKKQMDKGKEVVLLYLGDHDPSGMDMIRDIRERIIEMLEVKGYYDLFKVKPIALTMEQIKLYNPPKNPAKMTDPRAKWYIEKYGYSSWEVDALDPKTLNKLVSESIESEIDLELFEKMKQQEELDKQKLQDIADKL